MLIKAYQDSFFRIFSLCSGMLTNVVITRLLSIGDRASFALIQNDANLVAQIFNFGLHTTALIVLSRDAKEKDNYLTSSLMLIGIATIFYIVWSYIVTGLTIITAFTSLAIIFNLFSVFIVNAYVATDKIRIYNTFEIIKNLSLISLLLTFRTNEETLSRIYFFFMIVNAVHFYIIIRLFGHLTFTKSILEFLKNQFFVSIRSYLSCGIAAIITWYFIYFLKTQSLEQTISKDEMGYTIFAFNQINYVLLIFASVSLMISPQIIENKKQNNSFMPTFKLLGTNIIIFFLGTLIFWNFLEDIFSFIYGERYAISATYFKDLLPVCCSFIYIISLMPLLASLRFPLVSTIAPLFSFLYILGITHTSSPFTIHNFIDHYFYGLLIWCLIYTLYLLKIFLIDHKNPSLFQNT